MSLSSALRVLHLYISPGHNYFGHHGMAPGEHPTMEVPEVKVVEGQGIEGDRFFGYKKEYKGQVTFFDAAVYEEMCRELKVSDKSPAVFRRNIITAGGDLSELIGKEFEIQGVSFAGVQECSPCHWMDDAFGEGAEEAMRGRGGLRARVLSSGVLRSESRD